jgi:hypothetical protein
MYRIEGEKIFLTNPVRDLLWVEPNELADIPSRT